MFCNQDCVFEKRAIPPPQGSTHHWDKLERGFRLKNICTGFTRPVPCLLVSSAGSVPSASICACRSKTAPTFTCLTGGRASSGYKRKAGTCCLWSQGEKTNQTHRTQLNQTAQRHLTIFTIHKKPLTLLVKTFCQSAGGSVSAHLLIALKWLDSSEFPGEYKW